MKKMMRLVVGLMLVCSGAVFSMKAAFSSKPTRGTKNRKKDGGGASAGAKGTVDARASADADAGVSAGAGAEAGAAVSRVAVRTSYGAEDYFVEENYQGKMGVTFVNSFFVPTLIEPILLKKPLTVIVVVPLQSSLHDALKAYARALIKHENKINLFLLKETGAGWRVALYCFNPSLAEPLVRHFKDFDRQLVAIETYAQKLIEECRALSYEECVRTIQALRAANLPRAAGGGGTMDGQGRGLIALAWDRSMLPGGEARVLYDGLDGLEQALTRFEGFFDSESEEVYSARNAAIDSIIATL